MRILLAVDGSDASMSGKAADQAAERLRERHVEGVSVLVDGDVVGPILGAAADGRADVIVLGARDIGAVRRWLVGSVSRSVLHLAKASVLIVRPRTAVAGRRETAAATTA